jgi:spore coat protein A
MPWWVAVRTGRRPFYASPASAMPHAPAEPHAPTKGSAGKVPQIPPLKKFVDPLPIPATAIPDSSVYPGADYYDIAMRQSSWQFHRDLGPAKAWGYWAANPQDPQEPIGMGYLGPTFNTTKGDPTVVRYRNELPPISSVSAGCVAQRIRTLTESGF